MIPITTQVRFSINHNFLIALLVMIVPFFSFANEDQEQHFNEWNQWPVVGKAQLSWLFFDIYQSELLSPEGDYVVSDDVTPHPVALRIQYQRDISQQQLLNATAEQWQKLGYSPSKNTNWIEQLSSIFPSIESGDQLIYVTNGARGTFYHRHSSESAKDVGAIVDEELNDAFLAIWLSPNSEYPDLRAKLIGMN